MAELWTKGLPPDDVKFLQGVFSNFPLVAQDLEQFQYKDQLYTQKKVLFRASNNEVRQKLGESAQRSVMLRMFAEELSKRQELSAKMGLMMVPNKLEVDSNGIAFFYFEVIK